MLAGFHWFLPQTLAGSAQPGLLADLDVDLAFLREVGIVRIVSLTRKPLAPSEDLAKVGFELIHFPIPDMSIPTPRACAELCSRLVADLETRPALLHCRGGLGRTGTIAACCLVNLGRSADEALRQVRALNGNFVQTEAQARFIGHYASWLAT